MDPLRSVRWFLVFTACVALLARPVHVFAQAVVTDDADVSTSGKGQANSGKNPNLNVSQTRTTYLKFQLSSLVPDRTPASAIRKAELQLFLGGVTAPGRLDVFGILDPWDEATITAENAPPPAFLVATTERIPLEARSHFLTIDVTSLVQQWVGDGSAGGKGLLNQGLAISARYEGSDVANVTFDSKENSQTSHEPRLVIQLATTAGVASVSADAPIFIDGGATTPHLTLGTVPASAGGTGLAAPGTAGSFLRSTGSAWTSAPLSAVDVPAGSGAYIQNGTAPQAPSNFNISGAGTAGLFNAGTQFNLGGERVLANPGNSNLYVGRNTGTTNGGAANTFLGNNAGSQITTAIRNTFVGADAGRFTTSGGQNTFVGTDAGKFNTDAGNNVFFGDSAGGQNTTGSGNSFLGAFAGSVNTTGFRNVFAGFQAGGSNTTASSNTFVGTESGKLNTTGGFNSYFGDLAGVVTTTGSGNTLMGFRSGEHLDSGSDNVFLGIRAGDLTLDGDRNTFIGRDVAFQNVSGSDNTLVGSFSEFSATNVTGSGNTLLGAGTTAFPDISNAGAIGFRAQVRTSNSIILGSINGINGATSDTSVGIGTSAPQEKLDVIGGNIFVGSPGRGLVLRSPAGTVCRRLSIDNEGTLLVINVPCPPVNP
jgi:hypothetical protein